MITLRSNEFNSDIAEGFQRLREANDLFDVTLVCDGGEVQAHTALLAAISPHFQQVFNQNSDQNPRLDLPDVKINYVQMMIDFIYNGEVDIAQHEFSSFIAATDVFQVKGIYTDPEENQNVFPIKSEPRGQSEELIPIKAEPRDYSGKNINSGSSSNTLSVVTPAATIGLPGSLATITPTSKRSSPVSAGLPGSLATITPTSKRSSPVSAGNSDKPSGEFTSSGTTPAGQANASADNNQSAATSKASAAATVTMTDGAKTSVITKELDERRLDDVPSSSSITPFPHRKAKRSAREEKGLTDLPTRSKLRKIDPATMSSSKDFIAGDLVLVKFPEIGYWPSRIIAQKVTTADYRKGWRKIMFFGENETGWADIKDMKHYDDKYLPKNITPALAKALQQCSVEFKNRDAGTSKCRNKEVLPGKGKKNPSKSEKISNTVQENTKKNAKTTRNGDSEETDGAPDVRGRLRLCRSNVSGLMRALNQLPKREEADSIGPSLYGYK